MKPIEVKFTVYTYIYYFVFLFSCNSIEERKVTTNETIRISCNYNSLHKDVIYNRSVKAYGRIIRNSIYDKPEIGSDFLVSQKMCTEGNASACFNCYSAYSYYVVGNKEKYLEENFYIKDSLIMCYYLIKSFELDSTVADAIVKHRFKKNCLNPIACIYKSLDLNKLDARRED